MLSQFLGKWDEHDINDQQEQNDVKNNDEDKKENDDEGDTNVDDEEGEEEREIIGAGRENMEIEDNDLDESSIQEKGGHEQIDGISDEEKDEDADIKNEKNEVGSVDQNPQGK